MGWHSMLYPALLLIAAAVCALLTIVSWRRRRVDGAAGFACLMAAAGVWSLAYALELLAGSLPQKLLWAQIQYLGIAAVPLAWLAFVAPYSGYARWLAPKRAAVLLLVPLLIVALV